MGTQSLPTSCPASSPPPGRCSQWVHSHYLPLVLRRLLLLGGAVSGYTVTTYLLSCVVSSSWEVQSVGIQSLPTSCPASSPPPGRCSQWVHSHYLPLVLRRLLLLGGAVRGYTVTTYLLSCVVSSSWEVQSEGTQEPSGRQRQYQILGWQDGLYGMYMYNNNT